VTCDGRQRSTDELFAFLPLYGEQNIFIDNNSNSIVIGGLDLDLDLDR